MSIRISVAGTSIATTTSLPSPAAPVTFLGHTKLNVLGAGYQTVFALEQSTSSAVGYVSFGWLPSGNLAFDVQVLTGFADFGNGAAVGRWFDWFVQVDTVPATDVWLAGWRYTGTGAWTMATRAVSLAWTSGMIALGNNSYTEWGNMSFGTVKGWRATLSLAEIERELLQSHPVRRANIDRYSLFRESTDLRDYSGNGNTWVSSGTLVTDAEPMLPRVSGQYWFVPWAPASSGVTLTPAFAAAAATAVAPTVVRGAVSLTPAFASTAATAIAPTVLAGGITLTPAFAAAAATAIAPTVVRGAISLTPAFAAAAATAIAPTVVVGPGALLPDDALTLNPSNPLIANGPETYDALKAGPRCIVKVASNDYRMLYEAGNIADVGSTAYASSSNGTTWTKYGSNPVFVANSGAWEYDEASITTFFWDASISKWAAYFHGGGNAQPRLIGRATADVLTGPWTREATNPVLNRGGSGAWDEEGVADAKAMKVGSTYHLFYASDSPSGICIGHATSSDGISWTKDAANPVFEGAASGWDSGDAQSAGVFHDGTYFHMWYVGDNGDDGQEAIGYAYSLNGTNWFRGPNNPVLTKPGTANVYIGDTINAYRDNGVYRVQYGYFNFNAAARREIHEATLDVTGDGTTYMPAYASAVATAVAPTVVTGSPVTVTPAAAAAVAAAVAPTVVLGAITIIPAPAAAVATAITPTVMAGGSITMTPAPAAAVAAAIAPAVIQGAMTVIPQPATAAATALSPMVLVGVIVAVVTLHAQRNLVLRSTRNLVLTYRR